MSSRSSLAAFSLVTVSTMALTLSQASGAPAPAKVSGDWASIGGDPGSTKYSPLTQITPANVGQLKQAWTYDTGDRTGGARGWEITPIVVNDVMYFPTSSGKIVALDAKTGKEVWKTELSKIGQVGNGAKYGVSYWPGTDKKPPRIVVATTGGYMLQLDAKTGALDTSFAKKGLLDLKVGVMEKFGGGYTPGATPAIYKNIAIISPTTGEQGRYGTPGDPRAFDLVTGKELWRFHTVPQPGEPNFGDWGLEGWQDRRGPGSWVPMTVDTKAGLVFIALGNATDQNYGGNRPGKNSYATSVIALDARTGKLRWAKAMTYHDIFDWDVNAPPSLVEVKKDGKTIPAVAQSTKNGLLWILDRNTGAAVFGEEDRVAPASDAPGEQSWPVQPFPLKPEPISRIAMTRDEVNRNSPASIASCQAQYDKAVNAGPNTPYLMVPALVFPSSEGGGGWGGVTFDPQNALIFVNTRSLGTIAKLNPSTSSGTLESYAKQKIAFNDPDGYPCSGPPWGELMAINANTGDTVWRQPLGEYKELTAKGIPPTGTPNDGAPVATASGVLFIGATSDKMFRAYDSRTGKLLWQTELPFNSVDTPLTYQGKNGKQYVAAVVSSGLSDFNFPKVTEAHNNQIVAFALP